jgi:CubicO group peptidase (beta-lactamase class C family)
LPRASPIPSGRAIAMILPLLGLLARGTVIAAAPAPVSPERVAAAEAYVDRIAAFGFSGQVVVAEQGRTLIDRACGWADRDRGISLTPDTPLNIASMTKTFIAAAVLRLEMQGKLAVEDPLGKHLPGIPQDKARLTLHQLLTHTAGLARDAGGDDEATGGEKARTLAAILAAPLVAEPGERFSYSNDGYRLLAAVVEAAAEEPLAAFLARELFVPAGLGMTAFYDDPRWTAGAIGRGHDETKGLASFREWDRAWQLMGSGGIVSTARDLRTFVQALAGGVVLSPAAWRKMTSRHVEAEEGAGYGYGWFVGETPDGERVVFHGGDNAGYHGEVRYYPDAQRVVVLLANQQSLGIDGGGVLKRVLIANVARALGGRALELPPGGAPLDPAALARFAGTYRLDVRSTIEIWIAAGQLLVGARGDAAIAALLLEDDLAAAGAAEVSERSRRLLDALAFGRLEEARRIVANPRDERFVESLAEAIRVAIQAHGALRQAEITGTRPLPWNEAQLFSYGRLRLARGEVDLYLGWESGRLQEVTVGTVRRYPYAVAAAPTSAADLATYDLLLSKGITLHFSGEEQGPYRQVSMERAGKRIVAKREAAPLDAAPASADDHAAPGW